MNNNSFGWLGAVVLVGAVGATGCATMDETMWPSPDGPANTTLPGQGPQQSQAPSDAQAQPAPVPPRGWRFADRDGDGVPDYPPPRGARYGTGPDFVDNDGNGVCDHYETGNGNGWGRGWGRGWGQGRGWGRGWGRGRGAAWGRGGGLGPGPGYGRGRGMGPAYVDRDGDGVCDQYDGGQAGSGSTSQ